MQVEKKNEQKENLVTQETLNPLHYFNDESSTLVITAFSNSSETVAFKKNYFEIISSVQKSCKISTNDSSILFTQIHQSTFSSICLLCVFLKPIES